MHLPLAVQLAWYGNIAVTFVLLISLARSGLYRTYRAFYCFLLADFIQQIQALIITRPGKRVADLWMLGQSVKIVILWFVVLEMYKFAMAGQPAIARYGRRAVGVLLPTSLAVSIAMLMSFKIVGYLSPGNNAMVYYFQAIQRTVDFTVFVFLMLACAFLLWFPVRVPRNAALCMSGFAAYCFTRWITSQAAVYSRGHSDLANFVLLFVVLICLLAWAVLVRQEGEVLGTVPGRHWSPQEATRLMAQLEAFNSKLEQLSG